MKNTGPYPRVHIDTAPVAAVSQAGGILLTETVRATGLDRALTEALAPWRKPFTIHDPAKIVADLAIALALGGDALADIGTLRSEPSVYGKVASDATVSRMITTLATDPDRAITAISQARASARARAWQLADAHAPDHTATAADPMIIDLDATLITAHSDKQDAAPTFKRGYGFHPLCAFLDHGTAGTGEPLAINLRPGNAGSNTASDHISIVKDALNQLPDQPRGNKKILIRTDGAGGTRDFVSWLTGRRLAYSVGYRLPFDTSDLYRLIPEDAWTPAYDSDGGLREGADVAEFTGIMDLESWPKSMRVIVRRERPHPGAQLRFDDVDGYRLTAFATNSARGQLPDLEVRHRRRARCEDRIRIAKDTGLRNLPLHGFAQNRIWCQLVALASELTTWMGLLGHPDAQARRWETKRLRLRLFSIPAALARTGRRTILHLSDRAGWAQIALDAITRLRLLARAPG